MPTLLARNLYEEGKVCLSILGTWAGDKNESWSPARSSLLQALVSIQGLVLVKEPCVYLLFKMLDMICNDVLRWFCEPAYDKLRGTEEGIVNRYGLDPKILKLAANVYIVDCTAKRLTFSRVDSFGAPLKFLSALSKLRFIGYTIPRANLIRSFSMLGL